MVGAVLHVCALLLNSVVVIVSLFTFYVAFCGCWYFAICYMFVICLWFDFVFLFVVFSDVVWRFGCPLLC